MQLVHDTARDGWTYGVRSRRRKSINPKNLSPIAYAPWGVALLWYRHERRLSVSVWGMGWSRNYRLYGPRKLSFER